MRLLILLLLASALAGCSSGGDAPAADASSQARAVAPQAAGGTDCAGIHGNPPRPLSNSPTALSDVPFQVLQACMLGGGEVLQWQDNAGEPRKACLYVPDNAAPETPLPLLTFLQGSVIPADSQTLLSFLQFINSSADLSGDPARPGTILLVPYGRDTQHYYPYPDDTGLGWDNWHRNFDRADPQMNLDAAAIDHFIAEVQARGIVDPKRVYMSGWSNGAAMAILYGLNTPGIAATAVYSAHEAFSDIQDPCEQQPFGNNLRPIMTVHNDCDVIGICQTGGEGFRERLAARMPGLEYRGVIIDALQQEVQACQALCASQTIPATVANTGLLRHLTWPYLWTDRLFEFLRERPLP
ncbi:MAG TPA: PHB depolymerase family esterase [Solimonas sp.]|nr:PHB depolymerase family esterase [Solimonas sp.]